jgi:hypothetical protein
MTCAHNARYRWTTGFQCEDCNTWFAKDSPTYRSGELLSSIWMVLNNLNVDSRRAGGSLLDDDADALQTRIGIGKKHENYEELIAEAEVIMARHTLTSDSASMGLSF